MNASVFPLAHITLTAATTAGIALLVLLILRSRLRAFSLFDCVLVALVAGVSVLLWRSVGNTSTLNDDPMPGVSPNDVLTPLVTYLFLGFYAAFQRPADVTRFEQARVLLAFVCFVINVVTI